MGVQENANSLLRNQFGVWFEAGLIWNQGEGDTPSLERAEAYSAQYASFISELKSTVNAEIPIHTVRLSIQASLQNLPIVREGQVANSTSIVNTDDLLPPDGQHYTSEQYELIAKRMLIAALTNTPILRG